MSTTARRAQPTPVLRESGESRPDLADDQPVERWSTGAVRAGLRSGNPEVWRRLVAAVDYDPYGRTAHQVEAVVGSVDLPESISAIVEVIADARARMEVAERSEATRDVHVVLLRSGLEECEFALRIGVSDAEFGAYLDGAACPSAALMIRMARLADAFARARARRRAR